jgi:hypothetical protein
MKTYIITLYLFKYFPNYTQANLGLQNTTLGNRIHVQHKILERIQSKALRNGQTMVCAEYGNTEGSPNPNG